MRTRRIRAAGAAVIAIAGLAAGSAAGGTAIAGATTATSATTVAAVTGAPGPQIIYAPSNGLTSAAPSTAPCVLPDGSGDLFTTATRRRISAAPTGSTM